ncbi:hypothetical protein HAX54_039075 [Datura stramonium]|uniref:Uncharacterized protein n=1 Tax=Datura stramonium TaxID=4076 RepID=A0ABS8VP49_DATST|nr:hypothetical protein [Datura stramonium]
MGTFSSLMLTECQDKMEFKPPNITSLAGKSPSWRTIHRSYTVPTRFLEQILEIPSYVSLPVTDVGAGASSETTSLNSASTVYQLQQQPVFPLGLSLDNGFADARNAGGFAVKPYLEFSWCGEGTGYAFQKGSRTFAISAAVCHSVPQVHQVQPFQGRPTSGTTVTIPHQPAISPRVRTRRGQATDP